MHILDDNEKICAKCGKVFDDTFPFGFCLWCGYKLKKVNEYLHEENVEFGIQLYRDSGNFLFT